MMSPLHTEARTTRINVAAVELAIQLLCSKWTLPLYRLLLQGKQRSSSLRKNLNGISYRLLAERLREMERYGLVTRTVVESLPPNVEYELTAAGKELEAVLQWLRDFGSNVSGDVCHNSLPDICATCPQNGYLKCPLMSTNKRVRRSQATDREQD